MRKLFFAALLSTTCLTTPAQASPAVGGFVLGALGIGAAAGAAGAFATGLAAGAAFASTIGGAFVINTVVALGLSALTAALAPSPSVPKPSARMANFAQPIAYAEWVFGRARKGGPLGFTGFAFGRRYYVPILAAHPIEGVVEHWMDERLTTLNGAVDPNNPNIATEPMVSYGRVDVFTGNDNTANAGLIARFDEVTDEFDFAGLAGAVIWAKRPKQSNFVKVYSQSREWAWTPVIDGNNQIYDPRTDTTGFTSNAALILAYWLVEIVGREVDWDAVAIEADICDQNVTNAESGTQKRWEINGVISDEASFEEQRAQLAAACDAYMFERPDGKVGFKVGRWEEPTVTLTDNDFLRLEVASGTWGKPDEIAPSYIEPDNAWRETPSGAYVANESNNPVRDEPQLFLVNSHNQAVRVAKRISKTQRAEFSLKGSVGLVGYELLSSRFFRVEHEGLGVSAYFEVGEMTREGPALFSITANSVEPEDFEFDAATEEPARPLYQSVDDDAAIPAPASLNGAAVEGGAIRFTWPLQDDAYLQEIRYRRAGDANWQTYTTGESEEVASIGGLEAGITYEAQIRNVTRGAGTSDWAPDPAIGVASIVNTVPPGALQAMSVSGSVTVNFTPPNDPQYFATRIYRGSGLNPNFSAATLVGTDYGIPNTSDAFSDPVSPGVYNYWAEPINASGIAGPASGPEYIEVT